MCHWHMFSTDRSGEEGVRSTEQSVSIKVGDPTSLYEIKNLIRESSDGRNRLRNGD